MRKKTQTSSTPTTREKIRTTARVHTRLTRNNTPRMIPHRKTAPKINKEKETEFPPQQQISEGGQNKVRNRTI